MQKHNFFVSCAKGLELLVKDELLSLNIKSSEKLAGVEFEGTLKDAYKVCINTRLASQVLLKIATEKIENQNQLYNFVKSIDWDSYFHVHSTFKIIVSGKHYDFNNTMFVSQKSKDAIVDQFREKYDVRPNIDATNADNTIKIHLHRQFVNLYLCINNDGLHKRGYRVEQVQAPLKENLAAAILIKSGWLEHLKKEKPILVDPMCGSGTLLIEASLMAKNIAPILLNPNFKIFRSKLHNHELWLNLLDEAKKNIKETNAEFYGFDLDKKAISKTRNNVKVAELEEYISVKQQDIKNLNNTFDCKNGLLVTNPPYGERLYKNNLDRLLQAFESFDKILYQQFKNWNVSIFTGSTESTKEIQFRATKRNKFFNGALETILYQYEISEENRFKHETQLEKNIRSAENFAKKSDEHIAFANKLQKNLKNLKPWLNQSGIKCYRVYDADIPTFAVAVDIYENNVYLQEYKADATINPQTAKQRFYQAIYQIHNVLNIPYENIHTRVRQRQKGKKQYEKQQENKNFHIINEDNAKFFVNFTDYLDTGIFLDHRKIRKIVAKSSKNKQMLNLFSYTCTASVHSALNGATTTSVDMSNTYLEWGRKNFQLNNIDISRHSFIQADCFQWLKTSKEKFDVIFLDPPTFSNSKRMDDILDVQRDHVQLINLTMSLLKKDGILYFSNNYRRFKIADEILNKFNCENIDKKCLSRDFLSNKNIHNCWQIKYK